MLCTSKLYVVFWLLVTLLGGNNALIVSPRPAIKATSETFASPGLSTTAREDVSVARIRSTRRSDLEQISDLLSTAITGSDNNDNWKARVERLRVKESIKTTLNLRVRAIEEGKKYLSDRTKVTIGGLSLKVNDPDHLRYLWTKDSFRNKVEQAVELTSEPTPWEHHNFALAPDDPCWLRHEMITAEDIQTNTIVGFCEIATLLCPPLTQPKNADGSSLDHTYGDDYNESEIFSLECAPTIANLVVSPAWRRRGVAKGLVKSAERFVQRKWGCDELGLYVEKRNQRALHLYTNVGYKVKSSLRDQDQPDKWYMSKQL